MRVIIGSSAAGTSRICGQISQDRANLEKIPQNQRERPTKPVRPVTRINGQRIHFRDLARMAFPNKTDANLAFLAHVDARTARRWLAGDSEPPADVLGIVLAEIMTRFHQRD